ncbi:4Fe-4S dicluster domain-containing protein [Nocardia sp. NBC_01327]|uniref:4Fe-4S dicluster domain-containing protein n=1 Tax=Nocardia sp. NBC_01327 TaxID=2903593 RepID=UPI002E11CEF4|nr:4Fe-4S binding protein [Nocardia sp. NBC_01327]
MTYVITERCLGSKIASCYDVCPVEAIGPSPDGPDFDGQDQLFIDPVACIECGACTAVCPVEAIYDEDDVPEELRVSIAANRRHFTDEASSAPQE